MQRTIQVIIDVHIANTKFTQDLRNIFSEKYIFISKNLEAGSEVRIDRNVIFTDVKRTAQSLPDTNQHQALQI